MDGVYVIIVSETLEDLGGEMVMVPNGMYCDGEGYGGIDEVEIT